MEAVSRVASAAQQIMPLDFSYGSFSTEMVKAQARTCPLRPKSDRPPTNRDVSLRAMYGRCPRCKRNLTFLRSALYAPTTPEHSD